MPHPLIGKQAPSFSVPNYDGETYAYNPDKIGLPSVVFFYPKSGTYGCTKEACSFRDAIADKETFKTDKAVVIGISGDPVEKQKEFVTQHKLMYPVLSDAQGEVRKLYHVGKSLLGLSESRITFVVDSKGVIRDSLDSTLNTGAHIKFVTKWLDKLQAEAAESPVEPVPATTETAAETN